MNYHLDASKLKYPIYNVPSTVTEQILQLPPKVTTEIGSDEPTSTA